MMHEMFVNPMPTGQPGGIYGVFHFDFPAGRTVPESVDYRAPGGLCNVNVAGAAIQPGIESLYGLLGAPPMEQGHPCLREDVPESGDPGRGHPHQDQVLDIDRAFKISYTGRLSGSLIASIANSAHESVVKFFAHPLNRAGNPVQLGATLTSNLVPGTPAVNTWFWKDAAAMNELLYTADIVVADPRAAGLTAETVYRLISKWEFYLISPAPRRRLPMSGFNAAMAFELIQATFD